MECTPACEVHSSWCQKCTGICIIISDVGDYLGINQTVTFEVEDVEKEVQVQIVDNAAVERVEQFSVFLTPLPGVFPVAVLNSTAVVSITDNDGM